MNGRAYRTGSPRTVELAQIAASHRRAARVEFTRDLIGLLFLLALVVIGGWLAAPQGWLL